MKKYVKPDLYYENFELSQHVATCKLDMPNSRSVEDCYATVDKDEAGFEFDKTLFLNQPVCEFTDYEEYCYTNGGDGGILNIFNS